MQIIKSLQPNKGLVLVLGYFDGVHIGHQTVIKKAVDYAKSHALKSAVVTFNDHPCCFLHGVCPKYILTRNYREKFIADLDIDYLYELDFRSVASLSASEYLQNILVKYFAPVAIFTGFNHSFGANKSGDINFLNYMSAKYSYEYFAVDPQKLNNKIISSTCIREILSCGDIENANLMLGHKFLIYGQVIKGQQLGRTIGFKTANLLYPTELIDIPFGVYSVGVNYCGERFKGIANFGIRPTVDGNEPLLEVHIFNFDKDIYDEYLEIEFIKMVRSEQKFNSLEQLKLQIIKDIQSVSV